MKLSMFFLVINCILFLILMQFNSPIALINAFAIGMLINDIFNKIEKGE